MKTALVTGANKGIGLEVCRQLIVLGFRVFLTARNNNDGQKTANALDAEFIQLDVSDEKNINAAVQTLATKTKVLDVLVNNAGICSTEGMEFESQDIRTSFEINALGPLLLTRACVPLLEKSANAQVINVSSIMAQTADRREGSIGYRISKTALNAITRITSNELYDQKIWVNAVCPGWVRTDIGGPKAPRDVQKGAETIVWLANGGAGTTTSKFFRDQKIIDW